MVSRLLKSCATPPVSWPTASIFCDCRSASSAMRALVDRLGDAALQRRVQLAQFLLAGVQLFQPRPRLVLPASAAQRGERRR